MRNDDSHDDWREAWQDGHDDDDGEAPADDEIDCPHCQAVIHFDSQRCPHCGWYLSQEDEPNAPSAHPPWVTVTAILLLIALLLGAFGGAFWWW